MTSQTLRHVVLAASCAAALVAGACGGSSSPAAPSNTGGGTTGGGGTGSTATLSTISSQILVPRCTGCHGGSAPSAGMSLEPGQAYASLVNHASGEKPSLMRVLPGDPENSYLVQKLRGDAGIVGLRMPRNGPPYLTDAEIELVKQWIQAGAQNN